MAAFQLSGDIIKSLKRRELSSENAFINFKKSNNVKKGVKKKKKKRKALLQNLPTCQS